MPGQANPTGTQRTSDSHLLGAVTLAAQHERGDVRNGIQPIIDLADDLPIGMPAAEALGLDDPVFDIAITPNRPDALGVEGVARDLAARGLGKIITPAIAPIEGAFPSPITGDAEPPAEG